MSPSSLAAHLRGSASRWEQIVLSQTEVRAQSDSSEEVTLKKRGRTFSKDKEGVFDVIQASPWGVTTNCF